MPVASVYFDSEYVLYDNQDSPGSKFPLQTIINSFGWLGSYLDDFIEYS
jgi:hypothetical protein